MAHQTHLTAMLNHKLGFDFILSYTNEQNTGHLKYRITHQFHKCTIPKHNFTVPNPKGKQTHQGAGVGAIWRETIMESGFRQYAIPQRGFGNMPL
jgi:hypothetical protein